LLGWSAVVEQGGDSRTVILAIVSSAEYYLRVSTGFVPPAVDLTVSTNLFTSTQFLYTGNDPTQSDVAPGTIIPVRAAALRGQVSDQSGMPLPGVNITVLGHPELGTSQSRADGMFDMVVNGGGMLTVNYAKVGFLPVRRNINAPWQDYTWLPAVTLIPVDTNVTAIDLTSSVPVQVARLEH